MNEQAVARFWSKVEQIPFHECWEWNAARQQGRFQYGFFSVGARKNQLAHRVSYEMANGPIPAGLKVLHRCDNPGCVRPDHLRVGTQLDNMRDMIAKGRQDPARCVNHVIQSGDLHWTRRSPEKLSNLPRGEAHASRMYPERRPRGSGHARAKLTEADVLAIRAEVAGGATQRGTARAYGVSQRTVQFIVRRQTWTHI